MRKIFLQYCSKVSGLANAQTLPNVLSTASPLTRVLDLYFFNME